MGHCCGGHCSHCWGRHRPVAHLCVHCDADAGAGGGCRPLGCTAAGLCARVLKLWGPELDCAPLLPLLAPAWPLGAGASKTCGGGRETGALSSCRGAQQRGPECSGQLLQHQQAWLERAAGLNDLLDCGRALLYFPLQPLPSISWPLPKCFNYSKLCRSRVKTVSNSLQGSFEQSQTGVNAGRGGNDANTPKSCCVPLVCSSVPI